MQLALVGQASALDIGSNPEETVGITAGMTLPELAGALLRQGFRTTGTPIDQVANTVGVKVADIYSFVTPDGQSIVNVEAGADESGDARVYRILSIRFLAPDVDLEQLDRQYDAKFGDAPTCVSPTMGGLFHFEADGTIAEDADCDVNFDVYVPMVDDFAEKMLTGEGGRYTTSGGRSSDGAGQQIYMETVQDNRVAAEIYAAATGLVLPEESEETQAEFERIISGRTQRDDELLDVLTNPDGYPITSQSLRDHDGRQDAVDLVEERGLAFVKRGGEVAGGPVFEDSSNALAREENYDARMGALMSEIHGAGTLLPDDLPTLQRTFRAKTPFENGVEAQYRVSFASAPDGSMGSEERAILNIHGSYSFMDLETPPNLAVFQDWADRNFPGHCVLEGRALMQLHAYQTEDGRFVPYAESGARSCNEWARQSRDSGYSYKVLVLEEENVVRSLLVDIRDEERTQDHLRAVISGLEPDAAAAEIPEVARQEEQAQLPSLDFVGDDANRGRFPALLGVEFGMTPGEVVDLLKDNGFRFIVTGYYTTLSDEPSVENLTANLVFHPYIQRLVRETGNDDPDLQVYGLAAERNSTDGTSKYRLSINFLAPGGRDDYRDGTLTRIAVSQTRREGPATSVEDALAMLSTAIGSPQCTHEGQGVFVGERFWNDRMRDVAGPDGQVPCGEWEAHVDHRYQASYHIGVRGSVATEFGLRLEDHEPIRERFLD